MTLKNSFRFTICLFVLLIITACTQTSSNESEDVTVRITPVHVAEVDKGKLEVDRKVIGTASANQISQIIPNLTGELVELTVKKGDLVKQGQVIGRVDASSIEDNINLQKIGVSSAKKQVESALLQRNRAEKSLKDAKEQVEELKNNEMSNKEMITQAEAAVENAEQQLATAKIQVESARLQVEQAQLQLDQTESKLENRLIKAKATGQLTVLNARVGDIVSNTQPIGTIVSLDPIVINANLSVEELPLFEAKKEMKVVVNPIELNESATVTFVSPITNETGLYPIEAELMNKEEKVKPGMMITFHLPTSIVDNALLIPTDALVNDGEDTYVFIVEDNIATRKDVTVINSQSEITAIGGDISEGDHVITTGQITLADGNKVTIIEEASK